VRKARTELQGEARRKEGMRKGQEKGTERDSNRAAYKRISIIVDVIIIFHFQSKRYQATPPPPPLSFPSPRPFTTLVQRIKNRRELNELFIYLHEKHEKRV